MAFQSSSSSKDNKKYKTHNELQSHSRELKLTKTGHGNEVKLLERAHFVSRREGLSFYNMLTGGENAALTKG